MSATLQEIAREAYDGFEIRQRGDESFVTLRDHYRDTWLQVLTFEAHGDMLPDDFCYATIREACGDFADSDSDDDLDEIATERAEDGVDVDTAALLTWAATNLNRVGWCDEAVEEYGGDVNGLADMLALGQAAERRAIYASVLQGLRDRLDEVEDGDDV